MAFKIQSRDTAQVPALQSVWFEPDIDILVAGLGGVGVLTGCAVTAQGSPNMTLAVAAGSIRIASGATVAVAGGNVTIGAADATNPRIDLVSVSDAGVKTVTAGTAAASPKPPAVPSGHVALAMVAVEATDTAIENAEITDKRVSLASAGGSILQLDYALATDVSALAAAEDTWVDVITNQSFDVDDAASLVEIVVRGSAFLNAADPACILNTRLVIDSAGTPITKMLSGTYTEVSGGRPNPFTGAVPVYLSGLSVATHTVKIQFKRKNSTGSPTFYCRASTVAEEFLFMQVVEHRA
jgi:hypothetical protein